jgi:hypothetical protein
MRNLALARFDLQWLILERGPRNPRPDSMNRQRRKNLNRTAAEAFIGANVGTRLDVRLNADQPHLAAATATPAQA